MKFCELLDECEPDSETAVRTVEPLVRDRLRRAVSITSHHRSRVRVDGVCRLRRRAPGGRTPSHGGFLYYEMLEFLAGLAARGRIAGVDLVEVPIDYSDDDRIEKMFDALHRQSRDQQIIVFSCRQRAFERLGGNRLQMTEWRPDQG